MSTLQMTRRSWQLRDLVLMVVLGVVFGFLYWALVQLWTTLSIAMGPFGDLAQHILLGGWLIAAPLVVAIVRRPGSGVLAEIIASVVEVVFLGSPVGPLLIVVALVQGVGSELPFAVTRYRDYRWLIFALSGLSGSAAAFVFSAFRFGWFDQSLLLTRLGLQLTSGVLLGGILAWWLVKALWATGVLDGFAIGRTRLDLDEPESRG